MAKEKRPKILCAEVEEGEMFTFKGGKFKVLRNFRDLGNPENGHSKCLVIKPRTKGLKPDVYSTPVGETTIFAHSYMVRRRDETPTIH